MTLAPSESAAPAPPPAQPPAEAATDGDQRPPAVPPPEPSTASTAAEDRAFRLAMVGVVLVATAIQAALLHAVRSTALSATALFDAAQARMLEAGAWFTDPTMAPLGSHHLVPTVANAPLTPLVLAGAGVTGITGATPRRVLFAIVFVAAVVMIGLAVRDLVGPRAGVLAALLGATFPALWVSPATLGPDTAVVGTVALVLLATARFWAHPGTPRAALLGFALALAALARPALALLLVGVGVPLVLLVRGPGRAERLRCLGALVVVFALCLTPWVARGVSLFGVSGALSAPAATVIAGANCPVTYGGPLLGWWSASCVLGPGTSLADERTAIADNRHGGTSYAGAHATSVAVAGVARLGRALNVFRPFQTARLATSLGRPPWVSRLAVWYSWVLVPLAVVGAVICRRRGRLLFPFVALVVLSLLTVALGYANPSDMLPADLAFVALGGVALDAALGAAGRLATPVSGAHAVGSAAARVTTEAEAEPEGGDEPAPEEQTRTGAAP